MIVIKVCEDELSSLDELLSDAVLELLAHETPTLAAAVDLARRRVRGNAELTATQLELRFPEMAVAHA